MKDRILQKLLEFDYESVMRKIHGDTGTTLKRLKQDNAAKKAAERAAKLKQQQQSQQQQPQPENSSTDIRNLLINKLSKLVNESKPYQPTQADRDDEESYRAGKEAERDQGGVDAEIGDMAKFYGQKTKKPTKKPTKKEESTNLKDRMVEALIEARGDVTKKLGVTIPGDPKVNYGTTPVVPARGSDKAKRLADKTKRARNNLRSAQAETPESRRKASEEGAAKLAQLKASNRAKDRSVPGGTFRHRSGKDVEN